MLAMGTLGAKERWICPTDRELILRARLNSGWSVRSSERVQRTERIRQLELDSIEGVLERAKQVDAQEADRIKRMVCKLENMKTTALGDGQKTCSMCGISFGLFRTAVVSCIDCMKAVCEKCRIDMHVSPQELCVLCKICSENREVWKKSGGWFYGKIPQSNKVDDETEKYNHSVITTTWEHRRPDIVRLESFEPQEVRLSGMSFYKNWAVSSSPDLKFLDDQPKFEITKDETFRKCSERSQEVKQDTSRLKPSGVLSVKQLSVSCPSLQVQAQQAEEVPEEVVKPRKRALSKKNLMAPARKVMEKISKPRKSKKEKRFHVI